MLKPKRIRLHQLSTSLLYSFDVHYPKFRLLPQTSQFRPLNHAVSIYPLGLFLSLSAGNQSSLRKSHLNEWFFTVWKGLIRFPLRHCLSCNVHQRGEFFLRNSFSFLKWISCLDTLIVLSSLNFSRSWLCLNITLISIEYQFFAFRNTMKNFLIYIDSLGDLLCSYQLIDIFNGKKENTLLKWKPSFILNLQRTICLQAVSGR